MNFYDSTLGLKGSVSQDFRPPVFFHSSNPSRPLIQPTVFSNSVTNFVEIFDHKVVSAVCCTPQRSKIITYLH